MIVSILVKVAETTITLITLIQSLQLSHLYYSNYTVVLYFDVCMTKPISIPSYPPSFLPSLHPSLPPSLPLIYPLSPIYQLYRSPVRWKPLYECARQIQDTMKSILNSHEQCVSTWFCLVCICVRILNVWCTCMCFTCCLVSFLPSPISSFLFHQSFYLSAVHLTLPPRLFNSFRFLTYSHSSPPLSSRASSSSVSHSPPLFSGYHAFFLSLSLLLTLPPSLPLTLSYLPLSLSPSLSLSLSLSLPPSLPLTLSHSHTHSSPGQMQRCVIRLYVIKAQNLMPTDYGGFADPYLKVSLGA